MNNKLPCLSLVLGLALTGLLQPAAAQSRSDIVETAAQAGGFGTLLAAAQAAGLVEALKGPGPITLFAPTDAAFAALPPAALASLLLPENKAQLQRVLTFHVVPGRVLSTDLLTTTAAATLAGPAVSFGLRVGEANVIAADILCSNGVIHVIDRVLMPPEPTVMPALDVTTTLGEAIDRGTPLFNAGDQAGCAAIYAEASRALLASESALGELHAMDLKAALAAQHADALADASAQAWALRRVFDRILADVAFSPRIEAPFPQDFPGPGPVGRVVAKSYPIYRAARAEGGESAFWQLFTHIKSNDVQMTAPVEMTMDEDLGMIDMSFLYERPDQGAAGAQGGVAVLNLPPMQVLSIGMRGDRSQGDIVRAKAALEARLQRDGLRSSGSFRLLGYNSPMVPSASRFWELQVPVETVTP